jgi:hypothetical protein
MTVRRHANGMDLDKIIDKLTDQPVLASRYFAMFSRFEYALKETPPFLMDSNGSAQANWDVFANSLKGKFSTVNDAAFSTAVAFLKNHPPRKQVVAPSGNFVEWKETVRDRSESDEQFVVRLIRTIRNNLFHGGKSFVDGETIVGRNAELMNAGVAVMKHCLELSPKVLGAFEPE